VAKKSKTDPFREFLEKNEISPEVYAEFTLSRFQRANDAVLFWWETYWMYLAREREKKLDEIKASLFSAAIPEFRQTGLSRIVAGNHTSSPLSMLGSIRIPGRFNVGSISSSLTSFPSLYLASDEQTARAEKFLHMSLAGEGNLTPEEMYTKPKGPYLHATVNVELSNLLDLREKAVLGEFLKIVKEIKISREMRRRALRLRIKPVPGVIGDIETLFASIFESNFSQWQTHINLPSNSQWLGLYAKLAGLQGIIYPSIRNPSGFNLAVFPENFKDTFSFVELNPRIEHVSDENCRLTGETFPFFANHLPNSTLH
jgi:hypothetical protein